MEQIEQKIEKLKEQLETDKQLRTRLEELQDELSLSTRKVLAYQRMVDKEYQDILDLESASLNALFKKILGNYNQQMDQERQEYLEACLNFRAVLQEKGLINYELEILQQKLVDRQELESQLELLYREKESSLKSQNTSVAKRLLKFDQDIGKVKLKKYSIKKALDLGKKAHENIEYIYKQLGHVSNWGFREITISYRGSQVRQDFVDQALQKAVETQRTLNEFSARIESVFPESKPKLQIDQFKIFIQTLVHHLVTDWIVERRIKMALQGLEITSDQVTLYVFNLKHEMEECDRNIEKLVQEKRLYVENL